MEINEIENKEIESEQNQNVWLFWENNLYSLSSHPQFGFYPQPSIEASLRKEVVKCPAAKSHGTLSGVSPPSPGGVAVAVGIFDSSLKFRLNYPNCLLSVSTQTSKVHVKPRSKLEPWSPPPPAWLLFFPFIRKVNSIFSQIENILQVVLASCLELFKLFFQPTATIIW